MRVLAIVCLLLGNILAAGCHLATPRTIELLSAPEASDAAGEAGVSPSEPGFGPTAEVNIRVNPDSPGTDPQAEVSIAVNPTDPLNLIAAAINVSAERNRFYASFDGGLTWTGGEFGPTILNRQYDPTVAFCGDGSAYYESTTSNGFRAGSAILVYKSTDGGQTWPTSSVVKQKYSPGFPYMDKPWITCDTTDSTFEGQVYVEWMEVTGLAIGSQAIRLKYSSDAGASWSAQANVSDFDALQNGGQVAVGPGGEVYVTWTKADDPSDADHGVFLFDRSDDGGATFGTDIVIHAYDFTDRPEAEGNPSLDVDRTGGPHNGNVYLATSGAWSGGDWDIQFSRSTDGGATWSAPFRVNDDPAGNGAVQFHPAVVVDPDGRIIVTFNDNRHHVGERLYERWGAISRDGGLTFDTNFVISDVPHDRTLHWTGDYDAVTASSDLILPLWADTRAGTAGDCDVYTDRYPNVFGYDEVHGVTWTSETAMDFVPQDARFGEDLDYDVVDGSLIDLHADGGFDEAHCTAAWSGPPFVDNRQPAEGDGYYYVVRAMGVNGVGTFGDGRPRARINVRDALDEPFAVCP